MTGPASRRGFLCGLTTLPLIGGGVALIGSPTAVAEPITRDLLDSYDAWLFYERWKVLAEKHGAHCDVPDFTPIHTYGDGRCDVIPANNRGFRWQQTEGREAAPSTRAALVLATVGCDWREDAR